MSLDRRSNDMGATCGGGGLAADAPRRGGADRVAAAFAPLAVVTLALTAAAPLFRGQMLSGSDAPEHLARTAEYARALASGVWWPQWAPNLGLGHGEPIFLFNPPLFYILAALPTLAGLPVFWGVNLATASLLVLAGLGLYAWAAPFLGRAAAVVAAVAYVWAPYMLLDVYVRQALTELTAVCLFPWAVWALARVCRTPGPRRLALAAAVVALLLLGSTPATVVVGLALVGQVVVLAGRRSAGPAYGLAALALGVLLASVFWVPAAAERHLLRFDRLLTGKQAYHKHFIEPWQLFSSHWGYGPSRPGPEDGTGFGLGEAQLTLAAGGLGLLLLRRGRGAPRRQLWFAAGLAMLGAGMAMELSRPIWDRSDTLQYLQFPWRFLILPTLGCAALAAWPAALLARRNPPAAVVVAAICVGLLVAGSWTRARPRNLTPATDALFAPAVVANWNRDEGTAYEYETIWTRSRPDHPPDARLVVASGMADVTELAGTTQHQRFGLTVRAPSRLRLNTFYFPGWRVLVDGEERPIDYANRNGLIELVVEPGEHALEARFDPTPPRRVGAALSLGGLVIVGALVAWPALRSRRGPARRWPRVASYPMRSPHRETMPAG